MQRLYRPALQLEQTLHPQCASPATRSPTLKPTAPSPSSTTSPAHSWPGIAGYAGGQPMLRYPPENTFGSEPQIATAFTRTRTSFGPGLGISTISTPNSLGPLSTTAFICSLVISNPPCAF